MTGAQPGSTSATPTAAPAGLALHGITRRYWGVTALHGVDFDVRPGEIHALVGENGAGKSTLVKVMGGAVRPDEGRIAIDGHPVAFAAPAEALARGVAVIHQEFQLIPQLSVAENLFAGGIPVRRRFGIPLVDRRVMAEGAREILERLGVHLDPSRPVGTLGAAERQLVEIGKALVHRARFVVMDEPTASLEPAETRALLALLARLRQAGTAVVFVSHRIDEVLRAADRVTVLRDGRRIATEPLAALDGPRLVRLIVGNDVRPMPGRRAEPREGARLSARVRLGARPVEVRLGPREIVSVTGLMGAGASDVLSAVGAARPSALEAVAVDAEPARFHHPADALAQGVGMIPEDRKQALVPTLSVAENLALSCLARVSRGGFLSRTRMTTLARELIQALDIKTPGPWTLVRDLSGGNQQKVLLGRLLASGATVLVVDEPTRGVDVSARAEIHGLLARHADDGGSVLMSSADLAEVLEVSDRILVLRRGEVVAELARAEATQETVLAFAAGVASPRGERAPCS